MVKARQELGCTGKDVKGLIASLMGDKDTLGGSWGEVSGISMDRGTNG